MADMLISADACDILESDPGVGLTKMAAVVVWVGAGGTRDVCMKSLCFIYIFCVLCVVVARTATCSGLPTSKKCWKSKMRNSLRFADRNLAI